MQESLKTSLFSYKHGYTVGNFIENSLMGGMLSPSPLYEFSISTGKVCFFGEGGRDGMWRTRVIYFNGKKFLFNEWQNQ